jgi:hypothetical protein
LYDVLTIHELVAPSDVSATKVWTYVLNPIHRAASHEYFAIELRISPQRNTHVRRDVMNRRTVRFVLKSPTRRDTLRRHK